MSANHHFRQMLWVQVQERESLCSELSVLISRSTAPSSDPKSASYIPVCLISHVSYIPPSLPGEGCLHLSTPFLLEGCLLEGLPWWRLRALSHSHRPLSWDGMIQINPQAKKYHRAVCQTPFGSVRIFSAFLAMSHSFHTQKKSAQGKKIILPLVLYCVWSRSRAM